MRRNKNLVCDPAICDHCTYLDEGDFICDKNAAPNECHVVMEDWQPTDKYLWCQSQKRHKKHNIYCLQLTEDKMKSSIDQSVCPHCGGRLVAEVYGTYGDAFLLNKNGSVSKRRLKRFIYDKDWSKDAINIYCFDCRQSPDDSTSDE